LEEFGGLGHLIVGIDGKLGCPLEDSQLLAYAKGGIDMTGSG
jgi:hypothetical protein